MSRVRRRLVSYSLFAFALLLISGFLPMFAAAPVAAASTCPAGSAFRITLYSVPSAINMMTMTTGSSSVPLIFMQYMSPLGPVAPSGQVDTSYALTDWISHNANYTVWQLNVRPGLKWSDGTPVTSNDILTTYGPKFAFNSSYDFAGLGPEVKSEYAFNSSEAVYVLNAPDAQWPQKIKGDYYTPVMPAETLNSQGPGTPNFGTDVAAGPFYLSNYTAGSFQATLLRNPNFPTQPNICELDVNFVDSLSQTATYLQAGTTDFAQVEYSNAHAILAANPNIRLYDEKAQAMTTLDYNDSIYPYNMTAFRQALAYSVNQSAVVSQAFAGYGVTAYNAQGTVSPVATNYFNTNQPSYSYSPSRASSLLSSIGMTKGSDGHIQYKNGTDVSLTIWADTDNTADPVAAGIVQTDLQNLGFVVSLQTTSEGNIVGDYGSKVQGITHAILLYTSNVLYFGEPYTDILPGWDTFWGPTVASRHWLWPPSADALYQGNYSAYTSTADPTADKNALFNIEALNAQYLPTTVIAYPDRLFAVNTANWQGFPSGNIMYYSYNWNVSALLSLTSTSSSSPNNNTLLLGSVGAVVIVIVAAVAILYMRRKPKAPPPAPA